MYKCKFCSRELAKKNGLTCHEKACAKNPNRIQGKNQFSYGAICTEDTKLKQSKSHKGKICSDQMRQKMSIIMSERIKRNVRYSQQVEYNGIVLDSSWELKLAKSLDENNVKWIRPNALKWTDGQGKTRRYLPDFYLPDLEVYLEPKNIYLQKKDELKIKSASLQNKVKIILLLEEQCDWNVVKTML